MPEVTIRDLPEDTHQALKRLAAAHGRSTEAEIRHILDLAVRASSLAGLGSKLAEIGRRAALTADDLSFDRDRSIVEPPRLG